ncbi:PorP/SprF family type IX secretion system membrane protein [Candidatus Marifrigoribacter sp. Uisw_064]|uniref:PorP/SprF family type IX secretion system membrane protein n=1 Tax=Candidatus Marifrigoribacter sp. Uisw_064 TaxID=3230970 RepID=UPI003FD8B80B
MKHNYFTILLLVLLGTLAVQSQQDPQYTQYMYNTQVINPAYAGSGDALSVGLLYRTQWVGLEGAPKTATLTGHMPIGSLDNMGLGLSIVTDEIGPAKETNLVVDYSYTINTSANAQLAFGIKAGIDLLDVDFNKLNQNPNTPDSQLVNNVDNKFQPQIGAGAYYYTDNYYIGLSVPNFLTTNHFDESSITNTSIESLAAERLHYFLIAGYVFDINDNLKFKPATLIKAISGSPLQADFSANFLINDKFTLGAAYRWSAAMSAMVGFQATEQIFIGFGYDYQTTDIEDFSDGSYEFMLRFDVFHKPERVLTPRFF